MRSFFANLRQLVLPGGALPGTPRIVIGPDVPADLQAYYTALGTSVVAAIIYQFNTTFYNYEALLSSSGNFAFGAAAAGTVAEQYQLTQTGTTAVIITGANNPSLWSFGALGRLELAGAFRIDNVSQARGEIGASYGIAGNLVTCIGPEIAMPSYGVGGLNTNFVFQAGRLYQIDVVYALIYSAAAFSVVRVREGLGSTAGQFLGQANDDYTGPGGANGMSRSATFYVKNATAAAVTTSLGLSVQRVSGAGNISLYGGAPPLIVRVHDITDTVPALAGVAASIV